MKSPIHRAGGPASGQTPPRRALSRRTLLRGLGGVCLGLPWLEGLSPKQAAAQGGGADSFAIFFRQANGVAAQQDTQEIGAEPERFWPRELGPLTAESLEGRALDELSAFASRLLVVRGAHMQNFNYGDGHARGALQVLTAQGPVEPGRGGDSDAAGESIDHRIGRELNEGGNDSLFLYAGQPFGWLGGPCISYRGPGNRRSALTDPFGAYQAIVGGGAGLSDGEASLQSLRQRSVNDLLRAELSELRSSSRLSTADRARLDLHLSSVRDIEVALACRLELAGEQALAGVVAGEDGDEVLAAARLHMDVAALAVGCGYTRSVALQVGNGNDGTTRYRDPTTGQRMENFHYISHRRQSDGNDGNVISGSDLLHHQIDRQFAQAFRHLLERLEEYQVAGGSLLDAGVAVWLNDLGNGPAHSERNCPVVIAGSGGGLLRQGECVEAGGGATHARVLNTIGSAAGLRTAGGDLISDFGDPELDRSPLPELLA